MDGLIAMLVIVFAIMSVVGKATKKQQQQQDKRNIPGIPVDKMPAQPVSPQMYTFPSQPMGTPDVYTTHPMPPVTQPAAPKMSEGYTAYGSMESGSLGRPVDTFVPTEGVEFHSSGFHGGSLHMEPEDLGKLRAMQSGYTAQNLNWKAPEVQVFADNAKHTPLFTSAQLRQAVVMSEILDAPISRRRGVKRTYGR